MANLIRLLKQMAIACFRLFLLAPMKGSIDKVKYEWGRGHSGWKELVVLDIHRYFAPITGAVEGFKKELKRLKGLTLGVLPGPGK